MEAKIQKWGNSMGIRIPSNILKTIGITLNDILDISLDDDKIVISKPKKKFSLDQRIKEYSGPDLTKEFVWDEKRGKEIW